MKSTSFLDSSTRETLWEEWIKTIPPAFKADTMLLKKAYELCPQLEDLKQGLLITEILIELKCDSLCLAATIIYPTLYKNSISLIKVEEELGKPIAHLTTGVLRIQELPLFRSVQSPEQLDNVRKMLLAIVGDIRVVLIKLAERLTILRSLKTATPELQHKEAEETLALYAPLANRLGLGQIKWQLEDWCFRYLQPEKYKEISKALNMHRLERENYVNNFIAKLTLLIESSHIKKANIVGRAKHIYSIYRKMQYKQINFNQLYDTIAVRILVNTLEECYVVLGIVHTHFEHIPKEFDDYIAHPKPNGYRSIHTAVMGPQDKNVEIQIRTFKMHQEAELGIAAHWIYKEGSPKNLDYGQKINWLRQLVSWQQELSDEEETIKDITSHLFDDHVYVFTPAGDVFDLPKGATPIDFAYRIHSEIGHCCRGAKVRGKLISLTTELKTGDQVEIITEKKGHPSRDWLREDLGYVKTATARSKIQQWFKKQTLEDHCEKGQLLWEKACKGKIIPKKDIQRALKHFNYPHFDSLLAAIGSGEIGPTSVLNFLEISPEETLPLTIKNLKSPKKSKMSNSSMLIEGIDNVLTQLAGCCKPIPGDNIVGYITRDRGVTIHKTQCRNIQQMHRLYPARLVEVQWNKTQHASYACDLIIQAEGYPHLTRDITNIVASENIPLSKIQIKKSKSKEVLTVELTVELLDHQLLHRLIAHLKKLPRVVQVRRK